MTGKFKGFEAMSGKTRKHENELLNEIRLALSGELLDPPEWADRLRVSIYWEDSEGVDRALAHPSKKRPKPTFDRPVAICGHSAEIELFDVDPLMIERIRGKLK